VLQLTTALNSGTSYAFRWTGSNMITPSPLQINGGDIDIEYYSGFQNKRTYTLSGNYPALTTGTFSGTPTASCTNFYGQYSGTGGNVECTLSIPLQSTVYTNIHSIRIDFTNSASYSEIYPSCEAYVNSGSTTAAYGQLSCSRIDTTATLAGIRISGFTFVTGSVVNVMFKAQAKLMNTIPTTLGLELQQSGNYYTVHQRTFSISLTNGLVTSSKSYNFPFVNINRRCSNHLLGAKLR